MPQPKLTDNAVEIPAGHYLTLAQVAQRYSVYPQTVLFWVNHGWLRSIRIPGLGYIVDERTLQTFVPPVRGRHTSAQTR